MSVQVYRLEGTYIRDKREYRFSQEIRAVNEETAKEHLYSLLGSFHRVKRPAITLETITVISPEEAEKPLIRKLSGIE
ncbi:MAG: 50S ribosomal protein L18Ae [Promethearchaeota archaeon]